MKGVENERKSKEKVRMRMKSLRLETAEAVRPPEASLLLPESEVTALNRWFQRKTIATIMAEPHEAFILSFIEGKL